LVKRQVDIGDVVLAIVSYSPDQRVEGRTLLQKLAYFLNELTKLDIPFEPGYYGPYSEALANATDSLVMLGFLKETEERYPAGPSAVFEPRKYTYVLTPQGKVVFESIRAPDKNFFKDLENAMSRITESGEVDYMSLSLAAKMAHIVKSHKPEPMNKDEIMAVAHNLGWELSEDSIEKAAELLISLDLVKRVPPKKP
jgi:uncharacterized protein YwgA